MAQGCPICGTPAGVNNTGYEVLTECSRCGAFSYGADGGWISSFDEAGKLKLSGWVREQNAGGISPFMTMEMQRRILSSPMPRFLDRAMRLLPVVARKHPSITVPTFLEQMATDLELLGVSYSANFEEVHTLMKILESSGLLEVRDSNRVRLTAKGLLKAEELGTKGGGGAQGFVAMSFSTDLNDAWTNGFDPAIKAAGYVPLRIDTKEFVGGITDELMSEIRRSRFVVTDYTEQRNGVYFEAGFALGLGLTVIPTVRENDIGNLHFDIKHLNTLTWESTGALAQKLERRISAGVGAGPNARG